MGPIEKISGETDQVIEINVFKLSTKVFVETNMQLSYGKNKFKNRIVF